ncbi:hypothetical protein EGR_09489 [Echinococcus granulosus]|uniref:Uncharacterized protein n=1 Tax=Echinococcus granulosus TaxID=6210 RepID=W6UAZ9_ECHGR|nr:hypothetical protein EGR_09489 [Echinococcus granulosus]EUB55637.1 hypothetical protein EGR_09489 [Echinococcus granulosus]
MEAPVNRKNCSFEIAFDDSDPPISNRSPFTSTKPSKCSVEHGKAADEKMAEVIRRKSGILQQTREKYEAHNQKVKSVVEDIRAKRDNQIAELKENTEMRLEMASLRRRQTLEEKAESAKKMAEPSSVAGLWHGLEGVVCGVACELVGSAGLTECLTLPPVAFWYVEVSQQSPRSRTHVPTRYSELALTITSVAVVMASRMGLQPQCFNEQVDTMCDVMRAERRYTLSDEHCGIRKMWKYLQALEPYGIPVEMDIPLGMRQGT